MTAYVEYANAGGRFSTPGYVPTFIVGRSLWGAEEDDTENESLNLRASNPDR
ncbi:MAG: hypothetical protein KDC80_01660 [Saprospiraceae bacterium]|nr:hypothetical protein [Saprospiraceae bacterium]